MEFKKHLLWLPLAALISACGDGDTSATAPAETAAADRAPPSGSSCIADFAQRPCQLLTADLVRDVYPSLPESVNTSETLPTSSCQHSWGGDRARLINVGALEVEIPHDNRVALSWIRQHEASRATHQFQLTYRNLSEEEMAATLAALDEQLASMEGEMPEEERVLAGRIGRDMIAATRYEPVDNLGSAATWTGGGQANTLKVLDRDTEFGIEVDIDDDGEVNRELAIQLARAVIASCP